MQFVLDHVSSTYSQTGTILDQINLNISKGEFIGITGKAGCGKTTLLDTIAGLHKPESGQVIFEEKDIYSNHFDQRNFRKKLQMVFQFPENQFFETDVLHEITFGIKSLKISEADIDKRIKKSLEAVGLNDPYILQSSPFALSGGQKRRLALACAIVVDPEILLLDEPFSGLDAEGEMLMKETLLNIKAQGTTILMVSHDPNILCETCTRIITLHDGKIVLDGTPEFVYENKEKCTRYGIGQPDTKIVSDMIGLDGLSDLSYTAFMRKLTESIFGAAND